MDSGLTTALDGLDLGTDRLDMCVQFLVDRSFADEWVQVCNGRISTGPGSADGVDLRLSCPTGLRVGDLLVAPAPGLERARLLEVQIPTGLWRLHPPFDLAVDEQPLSTIPFADVAVRHVTSHSILGQLDFFDVFRDGQLVARGEEPPANADITVHHTFRQLTEAYDPALDSLTAVTGMQIEARHRALAFVAAGLYDKREFRSFLYSRSVENGLLSKLADISRLAEGRSTRDSP